MGNMTRTVLSSGTSSNRPRISARCSYRSQPSTQTVAPHVCVRLEGTAVTASPCDRFKNVHDVNLLAGMPRQDLNAHTAEFHSKESAPRMEGLVGAGEPLHADMGVYLRGADVGVAQHLLDGPQVGTAVKQVRRK